MAHSNETMHYHLPKYVGTDIINPLTDFNDANDAIDEAIYNANEAAANAVEIAQEASGEVGGYDARITTATDLANTAITKAENTMDMIADEFDPMKDGGYKIGDSVIYNQKLYTFINPHTGAWDAGDVKQGTITEAVEDTISEGEAAIRQEVQDALDVIAGQTEKVTATQKMIAKPFDAEKVGGYAKGAYVTYADKLYQFDSAHVGAWTGLDVTERSVSEYLEELDGKVVLSEEQFLVITDSTKTFNEKLVDGFTQLINLFNNKPADTVDIIIDGIDWDRTTAPFSYVCEWSMYDIAALNKVVTALYYGATPTSQYFHRVIVNNRANDTLVAEGTEFVLNVGSPTTSTYNDDGAAEASKATQVTIAYHYLYKIH